MWTTKSWTLKGKRALVTGGSKGIGKAIVAELLQLNASVLFTARRLPLTGHCNNAIV